MLRPTLPVCSSEVFPCADTVMPSLEAVLSPEVLIR